MDELESRVVVSSSFGSLLLLLHQKMKLEIKVQDPIYSICLDLLASDLPLGSSVIASPSSGGYLDLKI